MTKLIFPSLDKEALSNARLCLSKLFALRWEFWEKKKKDNFYVPRRILWMSV